MSRRLACARMSPILPGAPRGSSLPSDPRARGNRHHSRNMQRRNSSPVSLNWTSLLRALPAHQREAVAGSAAGPLPEGEGEQDDRVANSKLDRLAAELRALGIRF